MEKSFDIEGPAVRETIRDLVTHEVAITSTLVIFETFSASRPPMARENPSLAALTPQAAKEYLATRAFVAERPGGDALLQKEMQFEREFVPAGGLLMAGCDPTG
jgi:hypothetical protein